VATLQDIVDQLKEMEKSDQKGAGDRLEYERENAQREERLVKAIEGIKGDGTGGATVVQKNNNFGGGPLGLGALFAGLGSGIGSILSGLGGAGVGLGAFFLGLAGAEAIMNKFGSGDNLKNLLTNLAEGLSAFGDRELIALGAALGAGAIFGAVPGLSGLGAGIGIGAIGVGLGAFFAGLGAGEAGLSWMNVDGGRLKSLMINLADGLSAFSNRDLTLLGTLLAGGAAGGALFGLSSVPGAIVGMGAIGLGIGAFFAGLATADAAGNYMNVDGERLKSMMKNLSEGLSSFGERDLTILGTLLAGGAAGGGLFGVSAVPGAVVGMGAIGLGIGAFFAGLGVGEWALDKLGADGSGLRDIMINLADGLMALQPLSTFDAVAVGAGLASIGGGLVAFFGGSLIGTIMDKVDTFINWLTGDDTNRKNKFQNIVDTLTPFEKLKSENLKGLELAADSLDKLSDSMDRLSSIEPKRFKENFTLVAEDIAHMIKMLDPMLNGSVYRTAYLDENNNLVAKDIDFGEGLRAAQDDVNEASSIVRKAREIFSPMTNPIPMAQGQPQIGTQAKTSMNLDQIPPNFVMAPQFIQGGDTNNNQVNNNAGILMGSGPGVDVMMNGYSNKR
jgi:hypothetical protein